MAYCVGNCLSWDSVSGNLTINEDPLGGLECLSGGQKIRIAGSTTGVAVSNVNNGLFMTTAGELATKVTPQLKNYAATSATQAINNASVAAASSFSPYAQTPVLTIANPSSVYPMMVLANFQFYYDAKISGSGSFVIHGRALVNGVSELTSSYHESQLGSGNSTRHGNRITRLRMVSIPPSTSYTFQGSQEWGTGGSGATYAFFSANTIIDTVGFIMQGVA